VDELCDGLVDGAGCDAVVVGQLLDGGQVLTGRVVRWTMAARSCSAIWNRWPSDAGARHPDPPGTGEKMKPSGASSAPWAMACRWQ
jgi:hypothetical protein